MSNVADLADDVVETRARLLLRISERQFSQYEFEPSSVMADDETEQPGGVPVTTIDSGEPSIE